MSTQRSERTGTDRNKQPQDTLVNMYVKANAQALINVAKFRLCYQASPETRVCMEELKRTIRKEQPEISDVLVPNCVYRCGCPELHQCGYWSKFVEDRSVEDLTNIDTRYELYNKQFYGD